MCCSWKNSSNVAHKYLQWLPHSFSQISFEMISKDSARNSLINSSMDFLYKNLNLKIPHEFLHWLIPLYATPVFVQAYHQKLHKFLLGIFGRNFLSGFLQKSLQGFIERCLQGVLKEIFCGFFQQLFHILVGGIPWIIFEGIPKEIPEGTLAWFLGRISLQKLLRDS